MRTNGLWSTTLRGPNQTGKETPTVHQNKPTIDYPKAGEKVARGHYAIRVSGSESQCQVSIDGSSDWQNCRWDGGYWWYDWTPTETGTHRISVRTHVGAKWVTTEMNCRVV